MFDSLNVVYDEHEKRGSIRRTLVSLAFTLGMLVFVMVAMVGGGRDADRAEFRRAWQGYRHPAPRGALAADAGHRRA